MHAAPVEATPAEHAVFCAAHGAMHMGRTATLDQLTAFLRSLAAQQIIHEAIQKIRHGRACPVELPPAADEPRGWPEQVRP